MGLYVARNKNGKLNLFNLKPVKCEDMWMDDNFYDGGDYWILSIWELSENMFPEIKWEDQEPTKVTIQIAKKDM